jgi:hypothetical protein
MDSDQSVSIVLNVGMRIRRTGFVAKELVDEIGAAIDNGRILKICDFFYVA